MKILVLYRPKSEHRLAVEEFIRQFKLQLPESKVEVIDVDQRDGSATASLYDITSYPAVIAMRSDGSLLQCWQGDESLPRIDDVTPYAVGTI